MKIRMIVAAAGAVALLVGVVGLFTPVSVSPDRAVVACGSAVAPDLRAARSRDDAGATNTTVDGDVVTDADYTRLCEMELQDRRLGTITLAVAGALVLGGGVIAQVVVARRRRRRADAVNAH